MVILPSRNASKPQDAIDHLHAKDLVFGELRAPDVILTGEETLVLIDFDWCGRDQQARYPADISVDWADGAGPDRVMMKEHDIYRMRKMCLH